MAAAARSPRRRLARAVLPYTFPVDTYTIRATPARVAASSTRSVPRTLASYIAACSDFGIPTLYMAPTWNTASAPAVPRSIASGWDRSPSTSSQPSSRSAPAFAGARTSATTLVAALAELADDVRRR